MTSWRIIEGDCRERLAELGGGSVQTCVTSPPYFGLRDYGHEGQIGLEPTPDEFVAALVGVFSEVRRVLRDDGTVWLNLGDSYAGSWGAQSRGGPPSASSTLQGNGHRGGGPKISEISRVQIAAHPKSTRTGSIPADAPYKPKDLLGVPWMVAFAMRADGWYLRSDIIWAKPNPMPESVQDRPTKAHEYLFLLSKGPRYFYDADAIRETDSGLASGNGFAGYQGGERDTAISGGRGTEEKWLPGDGRNKRSVWTVATQPYPGAHFATFPPKLIEPCILAGCPERSCVVCGAPWVAGNGRRSLDMSRPQSRRALELAEQHGLTDEHIEAIRACGVADTGRAQVTQNGYGKNGPAVQALADEAKEALGGYYREFLLARPSRGELAPTCGCNAGWSPGTVLDPFAGAGTTGMVALRHGRSFIGCELSPEYVRLARDRIIADAPLLNAAGEAA